MPPTTPATGSAERWGPLWGARPRDWAENEDMQIPTYEAAIRHVGIVPGQGVLDVGCGTGVFLRLVADRSAEPSGLDASAALVAIARERVPGADVRVGDMEQLPYDDDAFDLVTGFNAFFFAADMVRALREARRVARPGAPVVIQVWGPPEQCDLEAMKVIGRSLAPPPPPGAPSAPELWRPGVLEDLAAAAGLAPEATFDTSFSLHFPDAASLGRLLVAPMGLAKLAGPEREPALRRRIVSALAPYRAPGGGYRLDNAYHYLVARA